MKMDSSQIYICIGQTLPSEIGCELQCEVQSSKRNVDIMGFCAFSSPSIVKSPVIGSWGNPFPRSINHKMQQNNNINTPAADRHSH